MPTCKGRKGEKKGGKEAKGRGREKDSKGRDGKGREKLAPSKYFGLEPPRA